MAAELSCAGVRPTSPDQDVLVESERTMAEKAGSVRGAQEHVLREHSTREQHEEQCYFVQQRERRRAEVVRRSEYEAFLWRTSNVWGAR